MNKYLFILIAAALIGLYVFRHQLLPADVNQLLSSADPFEGYRANIGPWREDKTLENGLWGAVAEVYQPADNFTHGAIYRSLRAFFKAYNIQPNGWQFKTKTQLQNAFDAFYAAVGNTDEHSFTVGQYV